MSLKYPTKENSSCMLLGTIGNPNSNSLNKDIIIMNKKKPHKKQTESLEMVPLQSWLIQQVKCSWLNPWGFRFFLSFCSAILHLFSPHLPQSHKMRMAVPGGASRKVSVSRRRDCLSLPLESRLLCSPLPARRMGSPWLAQTNQTYPWARKRVTFCEQTKEGMDLE